MLHEVTAEGGLGFCHQALPRLLPADYHGPLVVALDSNVLIDLQQRGAALLGDGELPEEITADGGYASNLVGLSDLLNLWLLRDIRFVVTRRSRTDAKRVTEEFLKRRDATIDALADSLAFQSGDWWNAAGPSDDAPLTLLGNETGLPLGADRDLVLEAQAIRAHVFLTRDRRVLEQTVLSGPPMAVLAPRALAAELAAAGALLFFGGTCGESGCPYGSWPLPAPDMGKWSGLLSVLDCISS